jgi:protease I
MDIMPKTLEGKKVAIIIAFRDFRDEEYFIPKEVLENSGAEVRTVSTEKGIAIGSQGGEANVNIILSEIKVSDFDAIVFIGGPGAPKYLDNETSYKIAQDAVLQGKILAAICISPTILAKSGVLSGKKATVWSSPLDKSAVKILKDSGANYQSDRVVIDGKIITANGPDAAGDFAEAIIRVLNPVLAP